MLEAVSNRAISNSSRRSQQLGRGLHCALLLVIFYGATCGLIHSHSDLRLINSTLGTALGEAHETDSTVRILPSGKDCLLCQFHQQLSHGLFHASPFNQRPPALVVPLLATALNNYYAPHKSSRGRAPPVASLL